MRLALRLGDAEVDVDVAAAPGATVGDLAAALAGGPLPAGTGLVAGERFLAPIAAFAAAGLRQGTVVQVSSSPSVVLAPPVSPVAELRVVGGLVAGARHLLGPGPVVLGREGDVVLDAPTVSTHHARLRIGPTGDCTVEDLGSCNGTQVDGHFVTAVAAVVPGAPLQLGAVRLRVGPVAASDRTALAPAGSGTGTAPFNRPPRRPPPATPSPIPVPVAPPEPAPAARFSWALLLAPLVIGAAMAVLFDPMMAAFALFSPVLAVGTWWEDRRRVARERRRNVGLVEEAMARFRSALASAVAGEAARRSDALADPAECVRRAIGPSTRLWERRRHSPDAFRLCLGHGDQGWSPALDEGTCKPLPDVVQVVAAVSVLARSPVEVDVGPGRVLGVVGDRLPMAALVRSLVSQAAVHHGPADLQVAVLADAVTATEWDWAKWLPHAEGRVAADRDGADQLASAWRPTGDAVLLVVVDGEGYTEGRAAPVRELLGRPSVTGIVVATSRDRLPASCTTVVELDGPDGLARATELATGTTVDGVLVAGLPLVDARRCARALSALDDPEAGDGHASLPATVPLLGLLGLGSLSGEALAARWSSSRPASLATMVGLGPDGPVVLDLVHDGPHALVAGTTGSGKSELLRTLVAALAAGHGPDRLNLVLVDYKGGSAFADCAGLPHVVGMVTDLDEHLGERALRSLEAELRHREAVLARAGCSDVDEYAGRPGGPRDPLPRLLVVIDEFATMKAELGDFVDSLVGIAQRGRSLGVHLVLATQRPSGAVSDNIRANTNLRVALRVQDGPDSTDVLGTPEAAGISRHRPGRGFVRLGHGEVVGFQAALVSTASLPGTSAPVRVRPFTAEPVGGAAGEAALDDGAPTDLARLVHAAREAAGLLGVVPRRRPWLDPLPATLDLTELPRGAVGLADEPDAQRQVPFRWEPAAGNLLLYGVAGSGTTTALASLALAAVAGDRSVHLYVLDFGNGALGPLAGLPHVGAVVTAGEPERQERLVRTLRTELERRRSEVGAGGGSPWPAVVLLVDNLGGLCAAFDDVAGMQVRDDLLRLLADGPSLGVAVVASADRPGAVPIAMAAAVQERLVFRMADPFDDTVFGLPAAGARRPPGRAVDAATRREVQVALPAPGGLAGLAGAVAQAAAVPCRLATLPSPIAVLPDHVGWHEVAGAADLDGAEWFLPVGLGDSALAPVGLHLGEGDHALVAGPARSGKSTVLCAIAALVAADRPDAGLWAIAPRRSPLREAAGLTQLVVDPAGMAVALAAALDAPGPQVVLVDDADVLDDPAGAFNTLMAARRPDLHLVAAGRADVLRTAYGHWTALVRRSRQGVALRPHLDLDGDLWHTVLPRRGPARFGCGRGYLVHEGQVELFQAAVTEFASTTAGAPAPHDRRERRR